MELYSGDTPVETISQLCSIAAYFEIYSRETISKIAGNSFSSGATSTTTSLSTSFSLEMYDSDAFDEIVNEENRIAIGKKIYLRVSISTPIPSYLDYQVEKCFVHPPDNSGMVFHNFCVGRSRQKIRS